MCCGTRLCCFLMCLILAALVIGFLFGFGVFKHGFHKLEDTLHACDSSAINGSGAKICGRPFLGFSAPPPF
ncbi:hypothetical protein CDL12_18084 [Handroanthus impetiginosus]|uniref:Uncharacterized protein n=1 Tax=Handroanthus impetiginosus TaxID=429701 RepID=A0A2G9GVN0_9LAMI|nr:hypothetical protein CDL12_18084 [Handroanthus impetiginosus]